MSSTAPASSSIPAPDAASSPDRSDNLPGRLEKFPKPQNHFPQGPGHFSASRFEFPEGAFDFPGAKPQALKAPSKKRGRPGCESKPIRRQPGCLSCRTTQWQVINPKIPYSGKARSLLTKTSFSRIAVQMSMRSKGSLCPGTRGRPWNEAAVVA